MNAVVKTPVCPLHTAPDPASPLADEALCGMVLEVLDQPSAPWRRVRTPYRYEGYAPVSHLLTDGEEAARWEALPKKIVRWRTAADVLARPDIRAPVLCTLPLGAVVAEMGEAGEGWTEAALADGTRGYIRSGLLGAALTAPPRVPPAVLRARIVRAALLYRASPYRWGGKTPWGIDCSGLVSMAYLLNGVTVYRDAALAPGFALGEIPRARLRPADALFFPGHVALYLGRGRYLHATARGGGGVTINSLDPADPLYRPDLARASLCAASAFR